MSDFYRQTRPSDFAMIRFWQRIPLVIRAIVSGTFVSTIGVYAWLAIGTLIAGLWAIVVMGGVLWLYWKYFSGSWWPQSTAEARRNSFRDFITWFLMLGVSIALFFWATPKIMAARQQM